MKKPPIKNKEVLAVLNGLQWPHILQGQKWKTSADSLKFVCRRIKEICALGMPLVDSANLVRELYWCALDDIKNIPEPEPEVDRHRPTTPYFDDYGIMFRLDATNLTQEELVRDYEFCHNVYASGDTIWWTRTQGGGNGGAIHDFLNDVRSDNNYAFGPTKKQSGWPTAKLAELKAVGVYQRKKPKTVLAKKMAASKPAARVFAAKK